ncbi:uncharacterized protein LOC100865746 [Apis florea]|uniref:uncharacterized protein LOC100865746 n=1 Tax=Apis florea TaxID=7463 RepID=UPI0006299874|nr:uncharacterized protein LOC100865746 [Apis florea]
MVQPAELLARLVNILGYIPPATEDMGADGSNQTTYIGQEQVGYHNDKLEENKEILERESNHASNSRIWTIGHEKIPRFVRPRSRAASEIRIQETKNEDRNIERTWSGPTAARKIQELMKSRVNESSGKERDVKDTKFSKLRNFALTKNVPKALISSGPWKNRFSISSEKKISEFDRNINGKDLAGQASLSIDDRRESIPTNLNPRRYYYTHTGAANNFNNNVNNNLLEETSLADFLRALTVLHASVATNNGNWTSATNEDQIRRDQPRRKLGTASLTPPKLPSLFTLFSPSPPVSTTQSNQNTITQESNINWNEDKLPWFQTTRRESRRGSLAFAHPTMAAKSRRFSLRPVATPISPPTPPKNDSPFLSKTKSTFLFESPKEPLILTERTPGFSTPIKSTSSDRRFSLRPTQNPNVNLKGGNTSNVSTQKVAPRWKAGILQRQIGQMNLRRRARAFSLSDVHIEDHGERTEPFHLSSNIIYKKNNHDTICKNSKTDEFVPSIENSGQLTSLVSNSERYSPLSQEIISTNSVRLEEKNVRIIDPLQSHSIVHTIPIENVDDRSNECISNSRLSDRIESTLCNDSRITTKERVSSNDSFTDNSISEYNLFANVGAESQEPLMEVKIEDPSTNIISDPFKIVTSDISSHHSLDSLAEFKTEKHKSHLPIDKS